MLRWNPNAVSGQYASAGCSAAFNSPASPAVPKQIGFDCSGPATVNLTTTGQITSTCPYDGAVLDILHLTLSANGAVFYDQPLLATTQVCYTTPAQQATVTFAYPVLKFDNTAQARDSASTPFYSTALVYSQHVFTPDQGVACGPYFVNVGTRFKRVMKEVGFTCSAVVPASSVRVVVIQ